MKRIIPVILCLFVIVTTAFAYPLNTSGVKFSAYAYTKRGDIGEKLTDSAYFKRLGSSWTSIAPRTTPQGLDHVYIQFDKGVPSSLLVADSKFTNSSNPLNASTNQMSDLWVRERLVKLADQYNVDSNITFKEPKNSSAIYSVDGDSYVYWEDGQAYYSSLSGEVRSKEYIMEYSREMKRFLLGAEPRKRVIQYKWEDNHLVEYVYSVSDEAGIPKLKELERRAISSLDDINQVELNDQIIDLLTVLNYSDVGFVAKLSNEDKLALISMKGISKETFDKIYNYSDKTRIAINRGIGVNSKNKIKGLDNLSDEKRSQIILGKAKGSDSSIKPLIVKYHISQAAKAGLIAAGIQSTITFGLNGFSQLSTDGTVNWKETLKQTAGSAGIGFVSGATIYVASVFGEKLASKLLSKAVTAGVKTAGTAFVQGALKSVLPSAVGFAIGMGMDYYASKSLPPELQKAVMKRSLLINGVSMGVSIAVGGAIEVATAGTSTPALAWILAGVDFATTLAMELLIPVPDEINPTVIREQYENNPSIVEEWAITNWESRMQLAMSF